MNNIIDANFFQGCQSSVDELKGEKKNIQAKQAVFSNKLFPWLFQHLECISATFLMKGHCMTTFHCLKSSYYALIISLYIVSLNSVHHHCTFV